MIKKFEEFINEGLWSKGIERSQTGEQRIENKNKLKDIASDFIMELYEYSENEFGELGELWLEFTSFLRLNDNDFKEDEDDMYPEWDLNDVLDVYTCEEFIDLCWKFINQTRDNIKEFDYDKFKNILDQ